ncbi:hypothetical protein CWO91_11370 [Bradyrhizobium genosp. SA-3]|nr:hypothetical protein CWO91_11370 [Bradyrhizobium genosp. SA-3]
MPLVEFFHKNAYANGKTGLELRAFTRGTPRGLFGSIGVMADQSVSLSAEINAAGSRGIFAKGG